MRICVRTDHLKTSLYLDPARKTPTTRARCAVSVDHDASLGRPQAGVTTLLKVIVAL
jgi:hypothetical protein